MKISIALETCEEKYLYQAAESRLEKILGLAE